VRCDPTTKIIIYFLLSFTFVFGSKSSVFASCCGRENLELESKEISDSAPNFIPKFKEEDIRWASGVASSARDMTFKDLKEKFEAQEELERRRSKPGNGHEVDTDFHNKRPSGLYVFVSNSMNKTLLKSYLKEAKKYRAILVFKGLPDGSFKEFNKMIIDLIGDDEELPENLAIQIDDEAFDNFSINAVPAFVLKSSEEFTPNQDNQKEVAYDKITGNIGIKYALEQFSESGTLADMASVYLEQDDANDSNKGW